MRSIPEKTLEHWASIYLDRRFPRASLWWPTAGEDVLVELSTAAMSGPGTTIALELKTTEAVGDRHELEIDTTQLERYLHPAAGPPMPVYYVVPVPRWVGPLTSRGGTMPAGAPSGWRNRSGSGRMWFGNWTYVLSAQSVAEALAPGWEKRRSARLFSAEKDVFLTPAWSSLLARVPSSGAPLRWQAFWKAVADRTLAGGVRWSTSADNPDRLTVSRGQRVETWNLSDILGAAGWRDSDGPVGRTARGQRIGLHIPG